jgi:hypothetical protein
MQFLDKLTLTASFTVTGMACHAATLHVGPERTSATVAAVDGDTVLVTPGTYTNDLAEIVQRITVRSLDGMAVPRATGDIPNGTAILITYTDITVDGTNGAGIHACNNDVLDIENGYIHHAFVGHEIESRANASNFRQSRVVDGPGSTARYNVDVPNGGIDFITNAAIKPSRDSVNGIIISSGEEGDLNASLSLSLQDVTIVNDLAQHVRLGVALYAPLTASLADTRAYGPTPAQLASGENGQGTFDITGTDWLKARPYISGKAPF